MRGIPTSAYAPDGQGCRAFRRQEEMGKNGKKARHGPAAGSVLLLFDQTMLHGVARDFHIGAEAQLFGDAGAIGADGFFT